MDAHFISDSDEDLNFDPAMSQSLVSISGHPPDGPPIVTLRMIMQGKEVGSIIGKKGENIKKFREESGCKINISDGSTPERLITMQGVLGVVTRAFELICSKFDEDFTDLDTKPPITFRLVVPATQCGSLIGKGGSKIKEIRDQTGASIQVASEMLPNSNERAVTVSGNAAAIPPCIDIVCSILLESPVKGITIPYRPKPSIPPLPQALSPVNTMSQAQQIQQLQQLQQMQQFPAVSAATGVPLQIGQMADFKFSPHMQPQLIPANMLQAGHQQIITDPLTGMQGVFVRPALNPNMTTTTEMSIPNELIGCIIGRGGAKINEIRQLSGANIKISALEEGQSERRITITGTPDSIAVAQCLINTSVEIQKQIAVDQALQQFQEDLANLQQQQGGAGGSAVIAGQGAMMGIPMGYPVSQFALPAGVSLEPSFSQAAMMQSPQVVPSICYGAPLAAPVEEQAGGPLLNKKFAGPKYMPYKIG